MKSNKFQTPIADDIKEETITNYEKHYGSLNELEYIEETAFYKDYLSKFDNDIELDLGENTRWANRIGLNSDLLLRLIAASLSSKYTLELSEDWKKNPTEQIKARLTIFVETKAQMTRNNVDELWCFQIDRLYSIYEEEQMNISCLYYNDDGEIDEEFKAEIEKEQKSHIAYFKDVVQRLHEEAALYLCLA